MKRTFLALVSMTLLSVPALAQQPTCANGSCGKFVYAPAQVTYSVPVQYQQYQQTRGCGWSFSCGWGGGWGCCSKRFTYTCGSTCNVPCQGTTCVPCQGGQCVPKPYTQMPATIPPTAIPTAPAPAPVAPKPAPKSVPQAAPKAGKTSEPSSAVLEVRWNNPEYIGGRQTIAIYSGSGTVIRSSNGKSLVLTNDHVMIATDGRNTRARVMEAHVGDKIIAARYLMSADKGDLALVEVDAELPCAMLASADVQVNDTVVMLGFPGHVSTRLEGKVLDTDRYYDDQYNKADELITTVQPKHGASGSGLFNAKGELCGVTHGEDYHNPPCGHHVRLPEITAFLAKYDRQASK